MIGEEKRAEMRWQLVREAFGAYLVHGGAPTFGAYLRSLGLDDTQDEPAAETLARTARIREKARAFA